MNWNEIFDQYLLNPHKIERPTEENLFCISILFQQDWNKDPLEPLAELRIFKATILHNIPKPDTVNGHDIGITIFYEDGQKALETALKIEKRFSHRLRVSMSYGKGLTLASHKSLHAFQAEKLNHFTNPHEITMTDSVKRNITFPDGLGAFQASKPMQSLVGFSFWVVKDYR